MTRCHFRRWLGGSEARTGRALALALGLGLASSACGPSFDSPAEVKELRILGIKKDKPYPAPGETVELTMLWHDPARRALTRTWFPLCFNPPGDLYYGCFADPSFLSGVAETLQNPGSTDADVFDAEVRSDVLDSRPPPSPGLPKYGLIFSFFALCSGTLDVDPSPPDGALPLVCKDEAGKLLGTEDFIFGYASMYVFPHSGRPNEFIRNQNPPLNGFEIAGHDITDRTCIDAACLPDPTAPLEEVDCAKPEDDAVCFDACQDDGEGTCPEIPIKPLFEAGFAERDDVSIEYYGREDNLTEQMWINYFVDRGNTKSDVRLLNDALEGPNEAWGTTFYAPKDPGSVTIWAVARDNRGGTSWARARVGIR